MIKRQLIPELKKHLKAKEITLIVGPRQAGKTTVMRFLKKALEKSGRKTLFLDLDREIDRKHFNSQEILLRKIRLELGEENGIVFIDEIQRKENAGLFLKGIYDRDLPYKFVVSGSGSIELKEKIHESLAGRKRLFRLDTLNFIEFVNYKTAYKYEDRISDFFRIEEEKSKLLLEEYLSFGGYPRVVLAQSRKEKQRIIDEIYNSYLEKDISNLLNVQKTESFTELVRIIAAQAGSLVNFAELSSTLGLSYQTVKDYLWYLEKTFILYKIRPFYRNRRKEITKAPIYYFVDLGLRNYAAAAFGRVLDRPDAGFLFQNFIYQKLEQKTRYTPYRINYWRTKFKSEVDFIFNAVEKLIPIEVKYKNLIDVQVPSSLRSFINTYHPDKAYIVNLSLQAVKQINNTSVKFIPYYAPFPQT